MRQLWRLLRSRSLAVWTIIAFIAYSALATTVSDGDWGVPYRSPIFLAIAGLLTLSTAACAWERTRAALKTAPVREVTPAMVARLRSRPAIVVPAAVSGDVLAEAEGALRGLRMRVARHGDALEARAGIGGAFGSPVFHWALALLFVFVALGQLTRAEGMMGVVAGYSKPDIPESYGSLQAGPWVSELTGRVIAVPSIESSYTANGVEQGLTPYVEIRSATGDVLAAGHAYANHPIRYRSMLVHMNTDGLGAVVRISGERGEFTDEVLLDYEEDRTAVRPGVLGVVDESDAVIATIMLEPGEGSTPNVPTVRVRAAAGETSPDSAPEIDAVIPEGESIEIPGGLTLTIVTLTKYARLSVVNDWSVSWIYALFALAVIGLVLAVFTPLRAARVLLVADDDAPRLHVAVRHGRGDPHFPGRVEAALREALGAEEES